MFKCSMHYEHRPKVGRCFFVYGFNRVRFRQMEHVLLFSISIVYAYNVRELAYFKQISFWFENIKGRSGYAW